MENYRIVELGFSETYLLQGAPPVKLERGYFHQWITDSSGGLKAIVEDKDGKIILFKHTDIRFTEDESNIIRDRSTHPKQHFAI